MNNNKINNKINKIVNKKFKAKNKNKNKNRKRQAKNNCTTVKRTKFQAVVRPGFAYLDTLLFPERSTAAMIPGTATQVVPIHRRIIQRYTTNAGGNFCMTFTPENQFHENTYNASPNNYIPLRLCTAVGYDGSSVPALADLVRQQTTAPFSVPEGTARQVRLVSASILVRSLSSNLNRRGDIHIALVNGYYAGVVQINAQQDEANFCTLPAIDNLLGGKYDYAKVENNECARCIWIPQDITCLDFKDVLNYQPTFDNFIVVIGIGLEPSSAIEVEMNFNFELTPKTGSLLQGMEQLCRDDTYPPIIWRKAFNVKAPAQAIRDTHARSIASYNTKIDNEVVMLEAVEEEMPRQVAPLKYQQKQYQNFGPVNMSESALAAALNNNRKVDFR